MAKPNNKINPKKRSLFRETNIHLTNKNLLLQGGHNFITIFTRTLHQNSMFLLIILNVVL